VQPYPLHLERQTYPQTTVLKDRHEQEPLLNNDSNQNSCYTQITHIEQQSPQELYTSMGWGCSKANFKHLSFASKFLLPNPRNGHLCLFIAALSFTTLSYTSREASLMQAIINNCGRQEGAMWPVHLDINNELNDQANLGLVRAWQHMETPGQQFRQQLITCLFNSPSSGAV